MQAENDRSNDTWRYASKAMNWYGWGSPVGLALGIGILLVSIGLFLLLLSRAGLIG